MLQTLFIIVQIQLRQVQLLYTPTPRQISPPRLQLRDNLPDTLRRQRRIRRNIEAA